MTQSPFLQDHRAVGDKTRSLHDSPPTPLPKSCFPCSPQMQHLFLGNSEWLLHLNYAAIMDCYVLKRLIAAIRLRALDLLHHILEDFKK